MLYGYRIVVKRAKNMKKSYIHKAFIDTRAFSPERGNYSLRPPIIPNNGPIHVAVTGAVHCSNYQRDAQPSVALICIRKQLIFGPNERK